MKILIVVYVIFEELDDYGEVVGETVKGMRSRRYEVHNSHDLQDTLNNMAGDIELQIEQKQLHKSKFRVTGIEQLVIHYDRYNPTRGGSYIELPKWIADQKHVSTLRTKIINVLNIAFNAVFIKCTRRKTLRKQDIIQY